MFFLLFTCFFFCSSVSESVLQSFFLPAKPEALFAVFDGHGGSQVSHIVSKEFPKVREPPRGVSLVVGLRDVPPSRAGKSKGDQLSMAFWIYLLPEEKKRR